MSSASMKLVKCKIELVTAELTKLGQPTEGTLRQVVERLVDFYEKHEDTYELADCTTCGGVSDADLPACPFCGTEGPVETSASLAGEQVQQALEDSKEIQDASGDALLEVDEDEDDDPDNGRAGEDPEPQEGEGEEGEDAVGKNSAKKTATKAVKAKAATKAKPAAKEAKAPKAAKAKGSKAAAPTPVPEDDGHEGEIVEGASSTALVSAAELDEQVKIIRNTSAEGGVLYHKLGVALNKISDEGLWKLRLRADGVPTYKSFKQFCTDELGSSPQYIYRTMNVAKHLTEEQVRGLSTKQVRVVMMLPPGSEAQSEVLAEAKQGKPTSKLTERANQLRGTPQKIKPDESKETSRAVTVAVVQGQHKLKMYKRPNTGGTKVGDTTDAARAKKLADAPWAVMDLSNKVRMLIRVQPNTQTGELVCVVEFRRGPSTI